MLEATSHSRARTATTAIFFLNGIGIGAWATSIVLFRGRLGLDDGELGLVLLALATGAVIAMPVAGTLVDRFGSGPQTRVAACVFAFALALPPFARSLPELAAAAFLLGASNGVLDIAMNAHASALERRSGVAIMSSFHASFSIGGAAGAAASALLASATSGTLPVLDCAAAVALVMAAVSWTSLGEGERTGASAKLAIPHGAAVPLCAAALLGMLCEGAAVDWSGVYLTTVTHAPLATASLGFGSFAVAMVIGRVFGDRAVRAIGAPAIVTYGAALACAGFAVAAAVPVTFVAAAGFAAIGLGLANVVPTLYGIAGRTGVSAASGIAMTATAGYAGFLAGPPIVGAIAAFANLRVSVALLAVFAAVVAVLATRMRRPIT